MHYLFFLCSFSSFLAGAHAELNLHELKVLCFLCRRYPEGPDYTEECQERRLERAQGYTQSLPKGPR